jgi:hypothetical protein
MSLHFDVLVGFQPVGFFAARRITNNGGTPSPDQVSRYALTVDDWAGEIEHRYGDDIWTLVLKALKERERDGQRGTDQPNSKSAIRGTEIV